ncbi:MAG: MFS transporter [Kocuria sp.]|nr:MFS transporter [Kocuria sp.]
MTSKHRREVTAADLSKGRRVLLLILVSAGSSVLFAPPYLKNVFYDPLLDALDLTNAQIGWLVSAYAITATICYLPSGFIADRFRMRTLATTGYFITAALTFFYAALPSYPTLLAVFVGMGLSTILIWWGVRFKLVRLSSDADGYARNIGLSYGIYGAVGLVLGFVNVGLLSFFAGRADLGVRAILVLLGALILTLGIASYLLTPRFAGEIDHAGQGFKLADITRVFASPVIWLAAGTMFFVYFVYTGVSYTTPYLSTVFAAPAAIVSTVSVIRTYGITLLAGPAFGALATKVRSPSKVILIASVVIAGALGFLIILPPGPIAVVVAAVIVIALGFLANGCYGIASSQLSEGRVGLDMFGAASGLLSVIGFLPDTFSSVWFGGIIDARQAAAYPIIFTILIICAILAAVLSFILIVWVKRTGGQTATIETNGSATHQEKEL